MLAQGVDTTDIFLDHAGFDTYNTMVRAKNIFRVSNAIVVTQQFHLPRAIFIARSQGIDAYGLTADRQQYGSVHYLRVRESFANIKAVMEVLIHKKPVYGGQIIPITGTSCLSYD